MDGSDLSPWDVREDLWLIPTAILLGVSAALFIYSYWLIGTLAVADEPFLAFTVLIALLSAAGYFFLLRWIRKRLRESGGLGSATLVLLAVPVAAFVFFGGTSQWRAADRYVNMLLPRHQLSLSVLPSAGAADTTLLWFHTSVGDVSYDTISVRGWRRQGDTLVLEDPSANTLIWAGITGEKVQLIFRGPKMDSRVRLVWDDHEEIVSFSRTKTNYIHTFDIPFYASQTFIILLGVLNFLFLVLGLLLAVIRKRPFWMPALERSVVAGTRPLDRQDAGILGTAIGLAVLLRAFALANVFPAVDEYYHLIAAQQIAQGASLSSVYPRGLWLVTLPVSLALRVFGHQLWAARLVGVLFNAAAVVPLYLIARRINRPIAALSCLLYATSPWIITFARVAREYAYYPFYFYWIVYAMVSFVEGIPAGMALVRDWRSVAKPRMLLLAAVLTFPPVFALTIDWLSTFRTILIAYLVFGLFVLGRFDWRERQNWPILALLGAGLAVSGRAWYQEQSDKLLLLPSLNTLPLEYFLPNPPQQWYFDRVGILTALGILGAAVLSVRVRRGNSVPLFMLALFISYLAVFSLLSRTFFHTRHLLTTQLWYVVVAGIGFYWIWSVLSAMVPWRSNLAAALLAAALGLSTFNVSQALLPSLSTNPDMPISEDYMHDLSQVQSFMLSHVQQNDVLISTVYGLYATWEERPRFDAQYRITSQTPIEDIFSIVDQNSSGWIVVDKIRLDLSSLSPRDLTGKHQIEYIGLFGDEYVWRWQRTPASAGPPGAQE
jgi:hypothetical protein